MHDRGLFILKKSDIHWEIMKEYYKRPDDMLSRKVNFLYKEGTS